ncbi:Oxidoreductase, short chain dehydrogenase/reductase family [Pseudomonas savastanoi pv. glycinea]|uniref:Oxidoreductase, short chain dehydrogenase/reductase family n=2 Tax=Pseudomonas savastanoi TaxID=29438 RepID=A0A3M3G4G3_PSESG|nr:Oxidoreductase, short chain dehydrogenase/reductase family [Pseudomonas savastanoi pv. phaseolicola]RML90670.1 Oxidoreductase, short chain dehydrogenase/reductase family [Pseudomonas savastanoi pv. glycinea]RMM68548.1 Oxidoreductase, short chain dehydrogenase/reductase family [Pseudomonas savastanoi pv. glycinea]RMN15431.1 Oxidoreductase, short chain dehydrogenase/reductase family [Pseudomonas savastanoi pv. glycinea]RMN21251.1 Oxidoreductase, short chain dehydrogenase/reductase family [Pseu
MFESSKNSAKGVIFMSEFWNKAFDLNGRCAVITGGAAGIGLACARLLAERGARVALLDRDLTVVDVAASLGSGNIGITVDLRRIDQVNSTIDTVFEHFKRIDYLVNSAGVAVLDKAVDVSEEAWDTTLDINLKASFFVAQACARHMLTQGSGRIVNLASQAAVIGLDRHVAYCASKAALVGMTKVLAMEWAPHINVNAISPTIVETALGKKAWAGELGERAKSQIPAGRFAQPEEIAGLALYLLSDAASMITGENVVIDGGYSIQ